MGATGRLQYAGNHSGNLHLETITFDNRQAAQVRTEGSRIGRCEPSVRTAGANWPGTHPRMRTIRAYLAAHHSRITRRACVKVVREALRETGQALTAGAAHFVDTRVDTGFRAIASDLTKPDILPEWRPGRMLTNVDIEAARRSHPSASPVSKC